nr:NHL repeat-containing protein [Dissulfurirhabdus thermomarina]
MILSAPPALAGGVTVKAVAELKVDDSGAPIGFPGGVAYAPDTGETYVLSASRGRVVVYDRNFFPRVSVGAGRGLDHVSGFALGPDGRLYVAQGPAGPGTPARIAVLDAAFFPVREIPLRDLPDAASFLPEHLAVARDGRLYVAGQNSVGVLVLSPEGRLLHRLTPRDTPPGSGERPVLVRDVAIDGASRLYLLSEETSKVYVYDAKEEFLFSFGQKGGSSGKMSRPRGLALDEARGRIYVVDYMRHTVLAYDLSGRYLFEFGGKGWGPGWFNFPTDVAVDDEGRVLVADLFNHRVQVLEVHPPAEPAAGATSPAPKGAEEEKANFQAVPSR